MGQNVEWKNAEWDKRSIGKNADWDKRSNSKKHQMEKTPMGQNVEWDITPTGAKNVNKHMDKKSANVHVHNNINILIRILIS